MASSRTIPSFAGSVSVEDTRSRVSRGPIDAGQGQRRDDTQAE